MEPRRGLAEPFACGIAGTQRMECLGSWPLGACSAFGPANAMWEEEMFGVLSDARRNCHGDGEEVGPTASSAEQGSGRPSRGSWQFQFPLAMLGSLRKMVSATYSKHRDADRG